MPQLTFTHRQADVFPLMWVLPAVHADMVHFKEIWMSELNASRLQTDYLYICVLLVLPNTDQDSSRPTSNQAMNLINCWAVSTLTNH